MVYLENIKLFISMNVFQREKGAYLECLNLKWFANCLNLFLPLILRPLRMSWRENIYISRGSYSRHMKLTVSTYSTPLSQHNPANYISLGLQLRRLRLRDAKLMCRDIDQLQMWGSFLALHCAFGPRPYILTVNRVSWSTAGVMHFLLSTVGLLLGEG